MEPRLVRLHDDENTAATTVAQQLAELEWACSVCGITTLPAQQDSSGRCDECRP